MSTRRAVALYARISQDRNADELAIKRQLQDCLQLAAKLGWTVAEEYFDDDITASDPRKKRPAYQRMLTDIADGQRDAVIVYHLDRLHRQPIELEQFLEVCNRAGMKDLRTVHGDIDIGSGDSMLVARIMAAVAANESDAKRRRGKRKALEIAQAGRPHLGGGNRPFGFLDDRITHQPAEAAVIRELAARVLAGESLGSAARWLEETGVRTVTGKPWTTTTVRQLLTNPRISGLRTHLDDEPTRAVWEPIIDPRDGDRLRRLLLDPARTTNRAARRYLLSGLLRCGKCGAVLVSASKNGVRRYRCRKRPGVPACGGLQITAPPVEEWITEAILQRLDSPTMGDALTPTAEDSEEHDALTADNARLTHRLQELADMYADGQISREEWLRARTRMEATLTANRRRLATITHRTAVDPYIGHASELRTLWADLNLTRQAAIVKAVMATATIRPATVPGRKAFDPARVVPEWQL